MNAHPRGNIPGSRELLAGEAPLRGLSGREPVVGVLGIQGSFEHHVASVRALGHEPRRVVKPEHLDGLTHLIIPGGESTTIHKLLSDYGMIEPIKTSYRERNLHLFGTCAGAILLGKSRAAERPPRFEFADVEVERNAYGRQVESFHEDVHLDVLSRTFRCVFIRAPRFHRPGPSLRILGSRDGEPILLQGDRVLLAAFHPELTEDPSIHRLFLEGALEETANRQAPNVPTGGSSCS